MPDGTQPLATQQAVVVSNEDLATMRFDAALEAYTPRFQAMLPPNIPVAHFKGVVITAVNLNPELRYADRRTFFNACSKCASDGLLPDGQEAALVVYPNTKVRDRNGAEHWIDAVQYLPMVAGIRKRMRNSGEVLSAYAEVVYAKDKFYRKYGDNPEIIHEPPTDAAGNQDLGADRGEARGAYAIIKLTNGEILRDVLDLKDIERARKQSKQPDGLMWGKFWGEAAKKTALRRCSKAAPKSSVLETLLSRDEEPLELPPAEELPAIPAKPRRAEFADFADDGTRVIEQTGGGETKGEGQGKQQPARYRVVDLAGEPTDFANPAQASQRFVAVSEEAASQKGESGLVAVWESNGELLYELRQAGLDEIADDLAQYHTEQVAAAKAAAEQAATEQQNGFWAQDDLHIPPPTHKGKAAINFKALRETMLAAVRTAPSEDHLGRFERDNEGNLQRFEVALKPAKQDVIAAIAARRGELRAGAQA